MGIISWLILLPFLTALAVIFTPKSRPKSIRFVTLIGTGIHLILTAAVTLRFWEMAVPDTASMKMAQLMKLYMVERVPWFDQLGIQYLVGIDGISLAMVILT